MISNKFPTAFYFDLLLICHKVKKIIRELLTTWVISNGLAISLAVLFHYWRETRDYVMVDDFLSLEKQEITN